MYLLKGTILNNDNKIPKILVLVDLIESGKLVLITQVPATRSPKKSVFTNFIHFEVQYLDTRGLGFVSCDLSVVKFTLVKEPLQTCIKTCENPLLGIIVCVTVFLPQEK